MFLCNSMKVPRALALFEPFWGQKMGQNGSFLGDFEPFLGQSDVILGSLRIDFDMVLASCFWSLWYHFEVMFGPSWNIFDHFCVVSGGRFRPKTSHFLGGWVKKCIETLKPYFEEDT